MSLSEIAHTAIVCKTMAKKNITMFMEQSLIKDSKTGPPGSGQKRGDDVVFLLARDKALPNKTLSLEHVAGKRALVLSTHWRYSST